MRLVTVLRNAIALWVFTIALANGQNFPNMGNQFMPPMGQNMFNQPNGFMPQSPMGQNMFNQPNSFNPQNMFPAGPQPPGSMPNPPGSNSPGFQNPAQNPFDPPFSSMPMPQAPKFPQSPAVSPNPQDFNSGFPIQPFNPAFNPQSPAISQGPIRNPSGPQNFGSRPPTPHFNRAPNAQGPAGSPGRAVNSPGPQQGFGSHFPQFNTAPNPQGRATSPGPAVNSPGPQQRFTSHPPTTQSSPAPNAQGPAGSPGSAVNSPGPHQDFRSHFPQFNTAPRPQGPAASPGPAVHSPGPQQRFTSHPPTSQSSPAPNAQGSVSQGPAVNSAAPQDPNLGSSAQSNAKPGPPASSSTSPGGSSAPNQQNPGPSSSGRSNSAPHSGERKFGPRRVGFRGRGFRRPSHTKYRPSHVATQPSGDPLKGRRIVCIFNNRHSSKRGLTPANIDPSLCTHLNYEFAMLDPKTYEMMSEAPDLDIEENFYQQAIDLKKRNPKLKVMLALGGWMDSTKKYSELAADPDKRTNFIEKAISFLKAHEFDGMDFAWEYPNCWQGAIGVNPKDKDNFITLLGEMKPQFERNGLILSASVGAIKREVEAAYDVPAMAKIVDFLSVMTYDMHGPWEKATGHHTQFESLPGDEDPDLNVKGGMQVWIDKGAPKHKLNMGLAFYGKSFRLADPQNCGLGAPAVGIGNAGPNSGEGGFLLYNEICQFLNSGNWTEKEDKKAGFYAHSGDQWACYDPPMMMVRKAKYVIESGLGGVLLKDLSGDDYKGTCFSMPFPLLKMVKMEMEQRIRKL